MGIVLWPCLMALLKDSLEGKMGALNAQIDKNDIDEWAKLWHFRTIKEG